MAAVPELHHALLDRLESDPAEWTRSQRVGVLGDLARLRAWLDARESAVLAVVHDRADDVASGARDVTQLLQQTGKASYGDARRRALRSRALTDLPATDRALTDGTLGTAQADELCALAERLDTEQRPQLDTAEAELVAELRDLTPNQARRRLQQFEQALANDDGEERLERQRQRNSLRLAKSSDGTTALFGQLDPVSAGYLRTCIDRKIEQRWRRHHAEGGPMPTTELTNERLRAEALVELVREGHGAAGAARGRTELLVLIDHRTLLGELTAVGRRCELADGTPLPASEIRRLACEADIIPIVMGGPSLPLDAGRARRLASGTQRAALRAVHDTCCVEGCDTPFDYCELHHVTWWRRGGTSDLDNLAPLCSKHHHLVHDHGWELTFDSRRVGRLRRAPAGGRHDGGSPTGRPPAEAEIGPDRAADPAHPRRRPRRSSPPAPPSTRRETLPGPSPPEHVAATRKGTEP